MLLVRVQRAVVRTLVITTSSVTKSDAAAGCPVLSGIEMTRKESDDYNCYATIPLLYSFPKSGKYTLQLDLVGMPFSYHSSSISPKATFAVVLTGHLPAHCLFTRTCGICP